MRVLGKPRASGTDAPFEALFRREFAPLVRALTLVAGDREAASDAVQDAFLQAHRHRDRVLALESPAGWLRHVALNRIRNHHRGQQRQTAALPRLVPLDLAAPVFGGVHDALPLIATLAPQQRAAVALYYLLDQPTDLVAEYLGISEATVRSHLRTARRRLQLDLKEEGA